MQPDVMLTCPLPVIVLTKSCPRTALFHNSTCASGASTAADGRSVLVGDAPGQVGHTMDVVDAILHSRGFTFSDVTRAIAYFKHPDDTPSFDAW